MPAIQSQPSNINLLSSTGYKFYIKKLPTTNFFVQSFNVPGVKLAFTQQPTPFININYYGDKVEYNDLTVTFSVDEDFRNYTELLEWIEGLGRPASFDERRRLDKREVDQEGKRSDCTIVLSTNNKSPNIEIQIQDAFPISLSDIIFQSTSTSENHVVATAVFKYVNKTIRKIWY